MRSDRILENTNTKQELIQLNLGGLIKTKKVRTLFYSDQQDSYIYFWLLFCLIPIIILVLYNIAIGLNHQLKRSRKANKYDKIKESMLLSELHEAKKNKLHSALLNSVKKKSKKDWATENDDVQYTEEQLNELSSLIKNDDMYEYNLPTLEANKEETTKTKSYRRNHMTFTKAQSPTSPSIPDGKSEAVATTKKEEVIDPARLHKLNNGKGYVFINKYLAQYLQINHPELLNALLKLCLRGKTQLPDKSKKHSGFIIREEQIAKLLAKDVIKKQPNDSRQKKHKKSANNKGSHPKILYIKAKDYHIDPRFFGKSTDGKTFEINGLKPTHADNEIIFFPSEIHRKN